VPTVPAEVAPAGATLVTADAATAESQSEERRGRKRRRRRGRGGRGAEGEGAVGSSVGAEEHGDDNEANEEPVVERTPAEAAAPQPTPAPATGGNGSAASPAVTVAVATPELIVVPTTYSPPMARPAPMPVEQLQAVLQLAGLSLVQTEPARLRETQARLDAEPRAVRVPRERPVLPPLDQGPLVQVETRRPQGPTG